MPADSPADHMEEAERLLDSIDYADPATDTEEALVHAVLAVGGALLAISETLDRIADTRPASTPTPSSLPTAADLGYTPSTAPSSTGKRASTDAEVLDYLARLSEFLGTRDPDTLLRNYRTLTGYPPISNGPLAVLIARWTA